MKAINSVHGGITFLFCNPRTSFCTCTYVTLPVYAFVWCVKKLGQHMTIIITKLGKPFLRNNTTIAQRHTTWLLASIYLFTMTKIAKHKKAIHSLRKKERNECGGLLPTLPVIYLVSEQTGPFQQSRRCTSRYRYVRTMRSASLQTYTSINGYKL